MRVEIAIRYVRFRASEAGGRIFDFRVSESTHLNREISVEIPARFFAGENRIHLQEGAGISSAKIKHFLEGVESSSTPLMLCLSAADLALHREVSSAIGKRSHPPVFPR